MGDKRDLGDHSDLGILNNWHDKVDSSDYSELPD